MAYTFLSSVFITLFLVVSVLAFYHYLQICLLEFSWKGYRHTIVMAVLSIICLILAVLFGTQIPDCYANV